MSTDAYLDSSDMDRPVRGWRAAMLAAPEIVGSYETFELWAACPPDEQARCMPSVKSPRVGFNG